MSCLGAHVSVAGGAPRAVERAAELACDAFQIFVKSPNQWRNAPRPEAECKAFREALGRAGTPVIAHSGYLINLASSKADVLERSRAALADELERCRALGVAGLVLHPGAAMDGERDAALDAVARSLDDVLERVPGNEVRILLENTAGQGSTLGTSPRELAAIVARVERPERLAVCLDTCHAFAAGYDLRRPDGLERLIDELDAELGRERLAAWHLNDSKRGLGEHRDRHANIGEGELGLECFARLVHDARFADLPMIVETPLGDDKQGHARDLETLRGL